MSATDLYEKLGAFYLGRDVDPHTGDVGSRATLYDSRDLVTHAVCVGMTGSGKTGLCVSLLEEAAIDGVPAIVIDPKGDLGNLLLAFPALSPSDFEPWVSADDARRKGVSVSELAKTEADRWRAGLEQWDQSAARIQRLRDAADFAIYTPGSSAGLSLSIVKSFAAPPAALLDEPDLLQERVSTTVESLLGLIGVDADPVQSREHILLSRLLTDAWREGRSLDLTALISGVQSPAFAKVGVLDLETFYPERERFKLAMALNNLVASPAFATWLEGEPLDVGRLLYGPNGRPRIAIVSIAHLGDAERMFFVSLLLNEVLGWVRTQAGTTNLRALLYMDEIFGYLPPVANPPSKKPLLTLMKQARAFGVGVVLATQNPVDLDYKALSNAGTWFIGRLQTAQDKARLLDALDSASGTAGGGFDRAAADGILSNLGKRVFLLHNVHDDQPRVFQTRWALSYLRGPLVREEIRTLMGPAKEAARAARAVADRPAVVAEAPATPALSQAVTEAAVTAPTPDAGVAVGFVMPSPSAASAGLDLTYQPALLAVGAVSFADRRSGAVSTRQVRALVTFGPDTNPVDWSRRISTSIEPASLAPEPVAGASFAPLSGAASRKANYTAWARGFADALYRDERLRLLRSGSTGLQSHPDEDERAFRIRLADAVRARRDEETERLRKKYAARVDKLRDQISTAERRVERERGQASAAKIDTTASIGATVFDALFGGRRSAVRGAATAARKAARAREQSADVDEARRRVDALRGELVALEEQCATELAQLTASLDPQREVLETVEVAPRKSDVGSVSVTLVWLPVSRDERGVARLACATR
ncbi:MAG: ATP-binding protein [Myxococcales bacterium]|nr:ATP-binding protein [Myxococcales bacterium]MCB9519511.1 ATP-binding protein [Myxococcales bacterium]MCB9533264.1 ATP-binding protein [Myxococcales bacterium]